MDGYRFFFYSNEGREPPHIHIERSGAAAKWWLDPVRPAWSIGFGPIERRKIRMLLGEHRARLLEAWHGR